MTKIILIGASGTIGKAVGKLLEKSHEVIRVGNKSGDHTVDLGSGASIEDLYETVGSFDSMVSVAGLSAFGKISEVNDDDFLVSFNNKLMGQINLVRFGLERISDGGSFTLTTGLFAREPWPGVSPTAAANAGLEGFVRAAALDMDRGIRINAVSPIFVTETAEKMGMSTEGTMSAAKTALAYKVAVEGQDNGKVLDCRDHAK